MKRPKQTDNECRRQGMHDVPVANYSKMQDKYIDYLEKKVKNNSVLDDFMNGFYEWHKEKGYITLKRDDFQEYLDSLKK
jgi:hypothetical protein